MAEPAREASTCTKEYFMLQCCSSAAGGLSEQTSHQQRLNRRHLYLPVLHIEHLGLAASRCRFTRVSCLCSDWYSDSRRPDIMT